jgi:hypothetical protein
MPIMSLAEYARHRGVTKAAVTFAIRDGRIQTVTDHDGKRRIDSAIADEQWRLNTASGGGATMSEPVEERQAAPVAPSPTAQVGFDEKLLLLPDRPEIAMNGADNSYARARAHKEHFLAKQAEQDYLQAAGKLVDVAIIKKEWTAVATTVRTKVLGIPSKAKQRIPDLTHEQFLAIEKLVRESLEDLSGEADE